MAVSFVYSEKVYSGCLKISFLILLNLLNCKIIILSYIKSGFKTRVLFKVIIKTSSFPRRRESKFNQFNILFF